MFIFIKIYYYSSPKLLIGRAIHSDSAVSSGTYRHTVLIEAEPGAAGGLAYSLHQVIPLMPGVDEIYMVDLERKRVKGEITCEMVRTPSAEIIAKWS